MVFMKGTRNEPACKFSRQMMHLLADSNITKFGAFNILENTQVREGLKTFGGWPTYPQLWSNGKLLGGIDACVKLSKENDFFKNIPSSAIDKSLVADWKIKLLVNEKRHSSFYSRRWFWNGRN